MEITSRKVEDVFKVKPGPKKKNLTELKNWIIGKIEEKGEVRWKELWNEGLFKSPKVLSSCLTELEKENVIEKVKISHKDIRYRKSGSYDLLRILISSDKQAEDLHPKVLWELRKMKIELTNPMERTAFITAMLIMELRNFLFALERTARAPTPLYTNWGLFLLGKLICRFGDRLAICGQTCPDETERALQIVYWVLYHHFEELRKVMEPYIQQLQPLPDIDLDKAKNDYKRLLKTLKNKAR